MTECVGRWRKERILLCVMFWIIGKELEKNVEKQREKSGYEQSGKSALERWAVGGPEAGYQGSGIPG